MGTLSLRLPESLHAKLKELAERDAISLNQFIASAVAEKAAALVTLEYLAERGRRGRRDDLDAILKRVPARPPLHGDDLPASRPSRHRRTKGRKSSRSKGRSP